jgi:hypothetical protein
MKEVEIIFEGIDSFNRPVFKEKCGNARFGSVTELFRFESKKFGVSAYFSAHPETLEYFGTRFGCEPSGGLNEKIKLKIVLC